MLLAATRHCLRDHCEIIKNFMRGMHGETREADIAACFPTGFLLFSSRGESFHNEVTEDASLSRFHGSYEIPDSLVSPLFSVPSTIPTLWLREPRLVNNTKCSRQTNIALRFTGDAVLLPLRKVALSDEYCFLSLPHPLSRSGAHALPAERRGSCAAPSTGKRNVRGQTSRTVR